MTTEEMITMAETGKTVDCGNGIVLGRTETGVYCVGTCEADQQWVSIAMDEDGEPNIAAGYGVRSGSGLGTTLEADQERDDTLNGLVLEDAIETAIDMAMDEARSQTLDRIANSVERDMGEMPWLGLHWKR
jgi:hypothetical protein